MMSYEELGHELGRKLADIADEFMLKNNIPYNDANWDTFKWAVYDYIGPLNHPNGHQFPMLKDLESLNL